MSRAGPVIDFACPVCGRIRTISSIVATRIQVGSTSGECPPGAGCRASIAVDERYRRFWLRWAGVPELELRRAGGAAAYVLEFGLPESLVDLAGVLPTGDVEPRYLRAAARGAQPRSPAARAAAA